MSFKFGAAEVRERVTNAAALGRLAFGAACPPPKARGDDPRQGQHALKASADVYVEDQIDTGMPDKYAHVWVVMVSAGRSQLEARCPNGFIDILRDKTWEL